jgi:hypothetical protein
MPRERVLSAFPRALRASTAHPERTYRQVPELFAVHGAVPDALAASVVQTLEDGRIAIVRGRPAAALPPGASAPVITPVYALQPGAGSAVPTGRVFVRFADNDRAEAHADALEAAGYRIVEVPPYAPQAAWVEGARGGIASSLAGTRRLEAVGGVVNVEPEMLRESGRR